MEKEIGWDDKKEYIDEEGEIQETSILIPQCCREGWDSCPHVVSRKLYEKRKGNIGL